MVRNSENKSKNKSEHQSEEALAQYSEAPAQEIGACWFLYLLECSDGSLYTGVAVDVAARYAAHVRGKGARYTRSHPPRRLLIVLRYPDRSSALRAEHAMKRLSRADKRRRCLQPDGVWRLRGLNAAPAPDR